MADIKALLQQLNDFLKALKDQKVIDNYALIGALATSARGKPRATKDIDFLVSTGSVEKFIARLATLPQFKVEKKKGDVADPIAFLIRLYDKQDTPIADFIISHLNWEDEIISSAVEVPLEDKENRSVPIPLAEDLIVLKVKAGGPQDLLDAEELLKVAAEKPQGIDFDRLYSLAKRARIDKNLRGLLEKLNLS